MTNEPVYSKELEEVLTVALDLEDIDEHLTTPERQAVVDLFRKENPAFELPSDLDEAYVKILYDFE
jgi:hypothetical protein